jgi:carbohydrate kinase (thermoresistant glucokinase family)
LSVAPILLVMGVAGSGKSTLGAALAQTLGWPFQEGDDLHPPANIAKMRAGVPLDDADRAPWLDAIGAWIDAQAARGEPGVVTCSALKQAYRSQLRTGRPQVRLVYVRTSRELVAERLAGRRGHYWPASLSESQFAALQEPEAEEGAIVVDARLSTPVQTGVVLGGSSFTEG